MFISEEPPHGATVMVLRRDAGNVDYLILHRAQAVGDADDWAWGPPAGARLPGEDVDACAGRELREATGLSLRLRPIIDDPSWASFWAEAPISAEIKLSIEHDRYDWVSLEEAVRRCQPAIVGEQFRMLSAVAAA